MILRTWISRIPTQICSVGKSLLVVAGIGGLGESRAAFSEEWMFRPSYYSHAPYGDPAYAPPRFPHRSAYRPAYVGEGIGFSARGGWRYNTTFLQSGNSTDITVQREGWFEVRP